MKQTYNEFFHIYGRTDYTKPVKPEIVIVEDSNAGYEFFEGLSKDRNYTVTSAGGKSNIFAEIINNPNRNMLIIADGAAFGPEMDRIMKQVNRKKGIMLYLPESFEWLVLKSGVISNGTLNVILEAPEDHIESSKYFSWERFFASLLTEMTRDTYLKYSKRRLNKVYLREDISAKIVMQMNGIEII